MYNITETGITIIILCLLGIIIVMVGCIIRNSNSLTPSPSVAFQAIFIDPVELERNANMYIREAEAYSSNIIVVTVEILRDDRGEILRDDRRFETLQEGNCMTDIREVRDNEPINHLPIAQPINGRLAESV